MPMPTPILNGLSMQSCPRHSPPHSLSWSAGRAGVLRQQTLVGPPAPGGALKPYGTPGVHTHEQWLGLVQPVGLVVAPAVLSKLELFPNQGTAYLSARQRQLEALLEERETPKGEPIQVVPGFPLLATDLLDWGEANR